MPSEEQNQIARGITQILGSLRTTLTDSVRARSATWEGAASAKELMMLVEAARFTAATLGQRRQNNDQFERVLFELTADLGKLNEHPLLNELRGVRYRFLPGPVPPRPSLVAHLEPRLREKNITVGEVMFIVTSFTRQLSQGLFLQPELPGFHKLRELLPAQKIAPAQFDIQDGRLIVTRTRSEVEVQDRSNVEVATRELLAKGERIVAELKASNCDRRVIETVEYLQEQLSREANAIQIGLSNIGCGIMCEMYRAELPDAVVSMLRAHTIGIDMYVGQFPDWTRFVENAAAVQISESDVRAVRDATNKLVQSLKENSDIVDPEVPRIFAYLSELLSNPAAGAKRATFAILRSIENLISRIFAYGADFLDATTRKTMDGLSSTVSKAVIVTLLTLALNGAIDIAPITNKVREMAWIRNAIELVEKQIREMVR